MNEIVNEDIQVDELASLKDQADKMGMRYHPNISVDKLRSKVAAALSDSDDEEEISEKATPKSNDRKIASRQAASELVRVRVTCMDQSKANQQGVLITTGNSSSGTVRKFVPFDVEWHVPRMIFNVLKGTKMQIFSTRKDRKGNPITESKLVNAYSIEELPQLTEAELKDLAQRQAMANGTA